MESFIDIVLQRIKRDASQAPPPWSFTETIPVTHWKWIQKECQADSDFDTLRLRQRVLTHPKKQPLYATCPYGSIVVCAESTVAPLQDIPWDLWGRILRLFYKKQPFTIYLLASPSLRVFPSHFSPIRPQNINGGYTYPCRPDTIVLYRAEDATRVLIHELQHASCLDHPERGIDMVEAETEAWAELFYTALLAKGDPAVWKRIWTRQWKWIRHQNQRVARHMRSPLSKEFPWRYTLGKEEVIRSWFPASSLSLSLSLSPDSQGPSVSLRLTVPPTTQQKREQGVRPSSTIL